MKPEWRGYLPRDRTLRTGYLVLEDREQGKVLAGPFKLYGKADNGRASKMRNIKRDPTKPFGDHPFGRYRIGKWVASNAGNSYSYGHGFLPLDPIEGEALGRERAGATGLGLHDGALDAQGRLRATHGCGRTSYEGGLAISKWAADMVMAPEFYECVPIEEG